MLILNPLGSRGSFHTVNFYHSPSSSLHTLTMGLFLQLLGLGLPIAIGENKSILLFLF